VRPEETLKWAPISDARFLDYDVEDLERRR
jgi:hypothetical protein